MIHIKLNKELDCEVYNDFKDFKIGGVDFGEKIEQDHPEMNENNYRQYISSYYLENKDFLEKSCREMNDYLEQNQQLFFAELKKIFSLDFSNNEYVGYLSIFNCNPRYLENKIFQIFYKKDLLDKIEVAYHEALHFAFFDYYDRFIEETKNLDKNNGPLWELSEIFNVLVLNLPQFQAILKRPEKLFYPGLKDRLEKVQNLWLKNEGDLKIFIKEGVTLTFASTKRNGV